MATVLTSVSIQGDTVTAVSPEGAKREIKLKELLEKMSPADACAKEIVMPDGGRKLLARGRLLFDGEPAELAATASGRVWELRTQPSATLDLPAGAIRAEETPAADGSAVHRILAAESPDETATPIEAGLEDGYLWLLSGAEGTSA